MNEEKYWKMPDWIRMNMISKEEGGNLYLVNGSFTKLADAGAFANQNSEKEEKTK